MHAAVIAINDAVEHQVASSTLEARRNPSAHLVEVTSDHAEDYQSALYQAKSTKAAQALAKVCRIVNFLLYSDFNQEYNSLSLWWEYFK